ncbi:hypothetical protein Q8G28_13605 [Lysinibacillus capsici]|uniref:hypothetical protein n=1 Tax=Lysinibacillus capsici TaxID=2115968 RepID=UPI002732024A|nr:hypothetical protein [Lysinibacillus capsici]MDP1394430.1 hypothetical protein [Lysinibacillus capsici]MDP1414899.1 hypothetical protein [Lysinibacillus capsici]MDP1430794.1 hypothetical protein [Lysinibacillus capsici]
MRNETIITEITEIVKKLSTDNQRYFLTLVKVAAFAEDAAKKHEYYEKNKKSGTNQHHE